MKTTEFQKGDKVICVKRKPFPYGHNPTKKYLKKGEIKQVSNIGNYNGVPMISLFDTGYGSWYPASNFMLVERAEQPKEKEFKVGGYYKSIHDELVVKCTEDKVGYFFVGTVVVGDKNNCVGNHSEFWDKDSFTPCPPPKKQPLTFKGYEVKVGEGEISGWKKYSCGCIKDIYWYQIYNLLDLKTKLNGQASLDAVAEFAEQHKKELGLK